MPEVQIMGLFTEVQQAADAIQALHAEGIPDDRISVLSNAPFRPEMLGRPKEKTRLGCVTLIGAFLGVLTAGFLTAGIFLLYPIIQGGQPIVPIPPSLIVLFELTMLGTMWSTFFGMIGLNRFPRFKKKIYDPRISEGYIGVVARVDDASKERFAGLLRTKQAADVISEGPEARVDTGFRRFWLAVAGTGFIVIVVLVLFLYNILRIPFPTNMADQFSYGYEQGPRLAAPANAIPVIGPDLIAGQPASTPLPADARSLQDGKTEFGINCLMCHGATGTGNGTVGVFFTTIRPADLTSQAVQAQSDQQIFLVITNGFKVMPPQAENLEVFQRWDVVNYLRTLKK